MPSARSIIALAAAAGTALALAAPAYADTTASGVGVRLTSKAPGTTSGALVNATLDQTKYADISVDISFQGFTANRGFAYRPGGCPADVVRLNIPAEVFQCGWEQEGSNARLRLAIRGTFPTSVIGIRLTRATLTTPAKSGRYTVEMSSWAFPTTSSTVRINA